MTNKQHLEYTTDISVLENVTTENSTFAKRYATETVLIGESDYDLTIDQLETKLNEELIAAGGRGALKVVGIVDPTSDEESKKWARIHAGYEVRRTETGTFQDTANTTAELIEMGAGIAVMASDPEYQLKLAQSKKMINAKNSERYGYPYVDEQQKFMEWEKYVAQHGNKGYIEIPMGAEQLRNRGRAKRPTVVSAGLPGLGKR